jgi:DNA-binding NarL/FixJ family response regulator
LTAEQDKLDSANGHRDADADDGPLQRERKVLLIEHQDKDSKLIRTAIISQSPLYDVDTAVSAEAALARLKQTFYDVIVVENELPDMAGESLVKALIATAPNSPIIVITNLDSPDLALKLLTSGASDYLPKIGEYQKFLPRMITTNLQRFIIIENLKEMYERFEQTSRDEALLNRFVTNVHGSLDQADVLERATQSLLTEFGASRAIICLIGEPDNTMRIARQMTLDSLAPISDKASLFGKYHDLLLDVGERRPLMVMHDDTFAFAKDVRTDLIQYHINSMLMIPLVYRGRLMGLLHLDAHNDTRMWTVRDITLLTRIASQLSIALSQAKLYQIVEAQSTSISKLTDLCSQLTQVVQSTKEMTERTESREKVRIKLSTREIEVLKKVAQGLSNKEIAEELHITEGTTEVHVSRLRKKLNLSTRAALVRYAYENHLS